MWDIVRKLFWVSRPVSWLNTAYPFAAGWLVSGGRLDLTFWLATIFFLAPYNLLMYGINDVFDYESDIRNPRKGGIEGMREQRAFHPIILWACLVLNLPFVGYLLTVGSGQDRAVLMAVLGLVVAYSLKGLRFKEIPVLDSVTSSLHFVGPLLYALAMTDSLSTAWPYVVAFFCWGMASHAFGAVQDIVFDKQAGLRSIATALGAAATVRLAVVLYTMAALLLVVQGGGAIVVGLVGMVYVANIVDYVNCRDADSAKTNRAWRRFIWLNLVSGFVITMVLLHSVLL